MRINGQCAFDRRRVCRLSVNASIGSIATETPARVMSASPSIATELRTSQMVRFVPSTVLGRHPSLVRSSPDNGHAATTSACRFRARIGHTGPCCCVCADGVILLNQKRLCVDLGHEDEWNSMRCFAFYGTGNPCAPVSPSALLRSAFTRTYGGCDHATGQASFEAETHNQSRHREGARCRRTGSFAGE